MTARKQYVSTADGQVHLRRLRGDGPDRPPILCLHPAPYSGLYFTTVMPLLGRDVIAPDYPGCGGSSPLPGVPTIGSFAAAMLDAADALDLDRPFDVLGFHTGCLVGAEMAIRAPERLGRLLMCDVPFFDTEVQADLVRKVGQPTALTRELESLEQTWDFAVRRRADRIGLPRSIQLLAEQLGSFPRDHEAFVAAFSYDCRQQFARITTPTTVIATKSSLREASHEAASVLPNAKLIEADDITTDVFETGATRMAAYVTQALEVSQ